MRPGQTLRFKYSGLFQSAQVVFTCAEPGSAASVKTISCEAHVQLPILKKSYEVSTDYTSGTLDWLVHSPLHEHHVIGERIEKNADLELSNVIDPVTFFMKLHGGEWSESSVKMLIQHKIVTLEVHKISGGYQIKRPDKHQQLIVRKDSTGISALEIPIPVIGTLSLKRL